MIPPLFTTVTQNSHNTRVDKYVRKLYNKTPLSLIHKCIRQKLILVNSLPTKPQNRLLIGDELQVPPFFQQHKKEVSIVSDEMRKQAQSMLLTMTEKTIFINKPTGLATQGGSGIRHSLDDLLTCWQTSLDSPKPCLVHRLDKDTSGVMLIARDKLSARYYSQQFKQRLIHKYYLALCQGTANQHLKTLTPTQFYLPQGVIDVPLHQHTANKTTAQAMTITTMLQQGRHKVSLWLLQPTTGRKHQLRLHMSLSDLPILGDRKYNPATPNSDVPLMLHAYALTTDAKTVYAPLSEAFVRHAKDFQINPQTLLPKLHDYILKNTKNETA